MATAEENHHAIVLTGEARRAIRELEPDQQDALAVSLRTLSAEPGPNTAVIGHDSPYSLREDEVYLAHACPEGVVIYRSMQAEELERLAKEQGRPVEAGFVIFDLVPLAPN